MGLHRQGCGVVHDIKISSPRSKVITMVNKISPWDEQEKMITLKSSGQEDLFCKDNTLMKSLSFKQWEVGEGAKNSVNHKSSSASSPAVSSSPKCDLHAAAVRVQKVFKGHRTRRNLADCAVVVEELWWKTLDSASLKYSSISFFNGEKPETAASRWSRARTRAAKVGKGLSKNDKAQKLALQHWLEAIDPRHRYGHNLHIYYGVWSKSESTEPFFYWLDIGEGKEVDLEKCPRTKLQKQCVEYLGPKERQKYEVFVESGRLFYKQTGGIVHTSDDSKWIFVLSTAKALYVGKKEKGTFQHSSFLAGEATISAGRLVVKEGTLKAVWPYSGHYLPTEENFREFINYLQDNGVDLADVKVNRCPIDKDGEYPLLSNSDEQADAATSGAIKNNENAAMAAAAERDTASDDTDRAAIDDGSMSEAEDEDVDAPMDTRRADAGEEKAEESSSSPVQKQPTASVVPAAAAGESKSHLACRWSTGTGPRILCVRDYPQDLQSMALEHVNLSPSPGGPSSRKRDPVPSSRPIPAMILSPRLASVGFRRPAVALTLPKLDSKRSRLQ